MKDELNTKYFIFLLPALFVWELLYQFLLIKLIPAADNKWIHSVGFIAIAAAVWFIYRKKAGISQEDDIDA